MNTEATANPRQKAIDSGNQRQNGQHIGPDECPSADVHILNPDLTHKI